MNDTTITLKNQSVNDPGQISVTRQADENVTWQQEQSVTGRLNQSVTYRSHIHVTQKHDKSVTCRRYCNRRLSRAQYEGRKRSGYAREVSAEWLRP